MFYRCQNYEPIHKCIPRTKQGCFCGAMSWSRRAALMLSEMKSYDMRSFFDFTFLGNDAPASRSPVVFGRFQSSGAGAEGLYALSMLIHGLQNGLVMGLGSIAIANSFQHMEHAGCAPWANPGTVSKATRGSYLPPTALSRDSGSGCK